MQRFAAITLLLVVLGGVAAFEDAKDAKVAMCRAHCLRKFHNNDTGLESNCFESAECSSCWRLCPKAHQREFMEAICGNGELCANGCQAACEFYAIRSGNVLGYRITSASASGRFTQPLKYKVNAEDDTVEFAWTRPESRNASEPLAYMFSGLDAATGVWLSIAQTFQTDVMVHGDALNYLSAIRLTAYNSRGKVAEVKKPLAELTLASWNLNLLSLTASGESHEGVDAVISWPAPINHVVKYEVVWRQVSTSVYITGHLDTTDNTSNLTLWPNCLYEVTVSAVGSGTSPLTVESRSLLINTTPPAARGDVQPIICVQDTCVRRITLIYVVAVCMVSLAVVLVYLFRRIRAHQAGSELPQTVSDATKVGLFTRFASTHPYLLGDGMFKHRILEEEAPASRPINQKSDVC